MYQRIFHALVDCCKCIHCVWNLKIHLQQMCQCGLPDVLISISGVAVGQPLDDDYGNVLHIFILIDKIFG